MRLYYSIHMSTSTVHPCLGAAPVWCARAQCNKHEVQRSSLTIIVHTRRGLSIISRFMKCELYYKHDHNIEQSAD